MAHPTARVLAVLELLQAHGRMSGAELARRLQVDVRTVRRYVATLEDIGIPVTADRGRHGAYFLVTGFKLPPLMFTDDEALAVSLGLLATRSLGLAGAAPAVETVQAKLERIMPANLKRRVRAISETATLDISEGAPARNNAELMTLATAAQQRHRVHIAYCAADGETTARELDVYGLVYRDACWYVAGYCHLRRDLRSFRVDRIRDVRLLDIAFDPPEGFDPADYLAKSIARIPRAFAVEVLLHADLRTAVDALRESLGLFEARGEHVLLRSRTDSIDWYARQLARLPFGFEILAPDELRIALQAHAARLSEMAAGRLMSPS